MRPLRLYLYFALATIALSVVASAGIFLVGTTDIGPLDPPSADATEHYSRVSAISSAVSSVLALMVGAIAVIAVIVAERAETRAVEQLKIDIARLWMTLHTLRNRGVLYAQPDLVDGDLDLFEPERTTIVDVLTGPTGFALYAWQAQHTERGLSDLTADLAGLANLLTLRTDDGPSLFNTISQRANKTADQLAGLTDEDMNEMASIARRLGSGLDQVQALAESDKIGSFLRDWAESAKSELLPPSQEEVNRAIAAADKAIGGQAGETVAHFGLEAMSGDPEKVSQWNSLLSQLGISSSDEVE